MGDKISRRQFLESSAAVTVGLTLAKGAHSQDKNASKEPLRIGIVGTGRRGISLLRTMMQMEGLQFPAMCDIEKSALERAQDQLAKAYEQNSNMLQNEKESEQYPKMVYGITKPLTLKDKKQLKKKIINTVGNNDNA